MLSHKTLETKKISINSVEPITKERGKKRVQHSFSLPASLPHYTEREGRYDKNMKKSGAPIVGNSDSKKCPTIFRR